MSQKSYNYTTIYVIIILIMAYVIFILIPSENTVAYVINGLVYVFPLPVSKDVKNRFSESIIAFTVNTRKALIELLRFLLVNIAYLLPDSILKPFIQSFPNDYIKPEQCIKKPKTKFDNVVEIPENLPWDEKINTCVARGGTIDDINFNDVALNQRVKSARPQIIIY